MAFGSGARFCGTRRRLPCWFARRSCRWLALGGGLALAPLRRGLLLGLLGASRPALGGRDGAGLLAPSPAAGAAAALPRIGCRVGRSRRGGLLSRCRLWSGRGGVRRLLLGRFLLFFLRNQGDKCFS